MTTTRTRLAGLIVAVLAVAVTVTGLVVLVGGHSDSGSAAAPSPVRSTLTPIPSSTGRTPPPAAADPAGTRPVRVRIPSIGVDSSLQALGVTASGVLQTPTAWQRAGWYADGVRPGDTGPAVIAGHVDSVKGPAVFARLTALRPGATVLVTRADHAVLRFVVDRTRRYAKKQFPTRDVYGPSSLPLLRLITCTGTFDRSAHSYLDNLVVTTHLVAP